MGAIGLAEAARLTGKNQSTIHRAMKLGRLSYTKNDASERRIDVAELERVFGIKKNAGLRSLSGNGASPASMRASVQSNDTHGLESERVIAAQRETIARQDATIADLRHRLDSLMGLLTDRRPWWRRWLR